MTYKKTEALQDAVRFAPLDRLMVETDSPFLAPVPHRGRKNEPAHVVETARKVAELKGVRWRRSPRRRASTPRGLPVPASGSVNYGLPSSPTRRPNCTPERGA